MEVTTLFETPITNQQGISVQKSVILYITNFYANECQPQVDTFEIPTINNDTVDVLTSEVWRH